METVVCDELKREMRECITNNDGIHKCKELIKNFEKICKKEVDKVNIPDECIKQFIASTHM
jgi:hypothetical protein